MNFECVTRACGWPLEKWPFFLAPLLTGEAQVACQVANAAGDTPYMEIKNIILDHLGLDAEAYRVRFRKEKGHPGENPKTLFFRLKMAADKWLSPSTSTKEEIMDKIYLEQYLDALQFNTQKWLRQHPQLTVEQAIEMATTYARAQPKTPLGDMERLHRPTFPKPDAKPKYKPIDIKPR